MKAKKLMSLIFTSMLVFVFVFVLASASSCGGGGGAGGGNVPTPQQANSSASTAIQNISMIIGTLDFARNFTELSELVGSAYITSQYTPMEKASKMLAKVPKIDRNVLKKAQIDLIDDPCPDGGYASFSYSQNRVTIDYTRCRDGDLQINGRVILEDISDDTIRITFQNFSVDEFYGSARISRLEMGWSLTVTYTLEEESIPYDGTLTLTDYSSSPSEVYTIRFGNYRGTYREVSSGGFNSVNIVVDGTLRSEDSSGYIQITYSNYALRITDDATGATSIIRMNGSYTIRTDKQGCFDGNYRVQTLQDIIISNSSGRIIGGRIRINDNIYVTWQSNGSVTVWLDSNNNGRQDSGETTSYANYDQLVQTCEISTIELE